MPNDIYQDLVAHRGREYRSDQIVPWSHYREPIDHSAGRLAGNSRVWGDASPEIQSRVIDTLIESSRRAGLGTRETAYVIAMAREESGFNPDAAAGTTSASGLGQFIDKTGHHYKLDNQNRFNVDSQADALVAHYIENRNLAHSRGQGEAYIYKYHHDGPTQEHGGLALSNREIMPRLDGYEQFVRERLSQTQTPTQPQGHTQTPAQAQSARTQTPAGGAHATSFANVMETVLPPQNGTHPHTTGHFGDGRSARPGVAAHSHGGVDFNYSGGGQTALNQRHPTVHAPVSGVVESVGGSFGMVSIRDANGDRHQILHMASQSVRPGQSIHAGDPIGTMGGRGPTGANQYAQHVHYQIRKPDGHTVNPESYWNGRTVSGSTQTPGTHAQTTTPNAQRTATGNALADGVLKQGERGDDVLGMQRSLNRLGVRDANGRPLKEDGDFGDHTREAVTAYQRANHLQVDGMAGPETLGNLSRHLPAGQVTVEAKINAPVALTHPSHPDHGLHTAVRAQLPGHVSDDVAASVTAQTKQAGIDSASKLQSVTVQDNTAFVSGTTPGFRARVDLAQPTPPLEQTSAQLLADSTSQQKTQEPQPVASIGR